MTYSNREPKAVLFDFDGTLLDSFPAHYRAYEVTLAHFNMKLTPELFKRTYTPDWFAMYAALGIPRSHFEEADQVWLAEVGSHRPQLFPEVRPLLKAMRDKYLLGLVTSGSRDRVLRDMASVGMENTFQVIITGDDVVHPKPHPEGLLRALEKLEVTPYQAFFVGDSREDCLMARAAAVPFVGISSEFATVSDEEGCPVLPNLRELLPHIEQF
jgi:HAD superfamily hydrolase (TIGR01509 family)